MACWCFSLPGAGRSVWKLNQKLTNGSASPQTTCSTGHRVDRLRSLCVFSCKTGVSLAAAGESRPSRPANKRSKANAAVTDAAVEPERLVFGKAGGEDALGDRTVVASEISQAGHSGQLRCAPGRYCVSSPEKAPQELPTATVAVGLGSAI